MSEEIDWRSQPRIMAKKLCPYGACGGSGVIRNPVPYGSTTVTEEIACDCSESV